MTLKRRILGANVCWVAVAVLLASATFAVIPATTASAAASCYAYSCTGHDPSTHGCAWDTYTYNVARDWNTGIPLANVWNWYSNNCHTNFAAASLTQYGLDHRDSFYVTIARLAGSVAYICYPGPSDTGLSNENCTGVPRNGYGGPYLAWTDMVEGTPLTEAHVMVFGADGNELADGYARQ